MKMSTLPGIVLELALVKACRNLVRGTSQPLRPGSRTRDKVNAALAAAPCAPEPQPLKRALPAGPSRQLVESGNRGRGRNRAKS